MHTRKAREKRTCLIQVRLTPGEMARVRALMDVGGYRVCSCYIRDLVLQRRLPPLRREVLHVGERELRERVGALIYEVNKIGVNYNQVVSIWQKQARQTRADGTPYMNTRTVEGRLGELMRLTEDLRDGFALLLDVVRQYIGESQTNQ